MASADASLGFQRYVIIPMYARLNPIGEGPSIQLLNEHVLVGRDDSCDVVLVEKSVSKLHCRLLLVERGEWYVQDRESKNGTYVCGKRIGRIIAALKPGDEISFGHRCEYGLDEI